MNGEKKEGFNRFALKIIIPLIFLGVVLGIWGLKNSNAGFASEGSPNFDFALHVTESLEIEQLKSYGLPIIIDFGADSCIPCKEMAPVLKELNEELQGRAIVKFVDVWKYKELAKGYPINLIPTQVFIDAEGKPYKPKDPDAMQMNLYTLRDSEEHVFTTHEGSLSKEQLLVILEEMGLT
ncbi:thioredoxin domain-containing protein [Desulfitobacterium dichloroeliminans LMG P-21439]|uniref:Thioredoxin domain-containing protein n=1 Tax=Desulfitobacterium dichloroeliminans (strain LMG P-21439 / DCA1) TaxID=871963 RepID=L0F6A4_DESDL|nr:thioredoxin family protein [Desulfitobacterium dichloroeliminans]AGA68488.1 thioredoxin domain-containing protein [Desulfitobacterium dichloroeliminans LMG P-21439]